MYRERGFGEAQGLGGALRIEQQARVPAAEALGERMLPAKRIFANGNRPLEQRLGLFYLPVFRNRTARLLRLRAVSGCSGPSAFSLIASARPWSGRAPARSP